MKKIILYIVVILCTLSLVFVEYDFLYNSELSKKKIQEEIIQKEEAIASVQTKRLNYQKVNEAFIDVAYKEIGNVGGYKYKAAFSMSEDANWCAAFVSWCIKQSNYDSLDVLPICTSTTMFENWFKENDLFYDNTLIPNMGMIILFDFGNVDDESYRDGVCDHVGIVEKVVGQSVLVIEGNYNNAVCENAYALDDINILGYGKPLFDESKLDKLMKLNVV